MSDERGIDTAISIFDKHAPELLTMPVMVGNTYTTMDLLKELMFDDRDLADYSMLFKRMKKLPALLTFYGLLKDRATSVAEDLDDEFKMWYAQQAEIAKNYLNDAQKDFKSSMMKPATIGEIEGRVMLDKTTEWREWREKKNKARDRVATLSRLLEGLQASVKLVGSESSLLQALISRGIEVITNPASKYSGLNQHQP